MKDSRYQQSGSVLAEILHTVTYDTLPTDVVEQIKLFMLDTFGVIGAARDADGISQLTQALLEWECGGPASLLVNHAKVSPATAAMINATAAHSLDFDDQHDPARVHTFCVILPSVLAAAEAKGTVSGENFITAVAVGVELFCRLGLACFNSLSHGWHPTTLLGSICAAAAAAKILGLDRERTLNAMGLAYVQTCGTTQFIADGVLAKRTGPGFAARNGLIAAQMALHGITGPERFLEGQAGLFALYEQGEANPDVLFSEWHTTWHIRALSMKPWPCCRCNHTVIQLAIRLAEKGLKVDSIQHGVIELSAVNHSIVGGKFDPAHPNPSVHAQFNATYNFVSALTAGNVTIDSFHADSVRNTAPQWEKIIECRVSPDFDYSAVAPARIRLTLKNGEKIDIADLTMKGSPENPLTTQEVLNKFRANLRYGWRVAPQRINVLEKTLLSFELLASVSLFVSLFRTLTSEDNENDRV